MMSKNFIFLVVVLSSLLASCKREGCMDKKATNYDGAAKKDCSCCKYTGRAVFWYDQHTASLLKADDAIVLNYYVNGELAGSTSTDTYWIISPDCGQNGAVTVSMDLGGSRNLSYPYQVKDQSGHVYFQGNINFEGNTCSALQLVW